MAHPRLSTAFGHDSEAAHFIADLESVPFALTITDPEASEGVTLPSPLPAALGAGAPPGTVIQFEPDLEDGLDALVNVVSGWHPKSNPMLGTFAFPEGEEVTRTFTAMESEAGASVALVFDDGSDVLVRRKTRELPPDDPSRLMETVTVEEYGAIESLIGLVQNLLDEADTDDVVRQRVEGAIDVLRGTHRAIAAGQHKRLELYATTKAVLRYVYKELPIDIVKWSGAVTVLKVWYPSIVEMLKSLG